ncbi:MAG TPA: hypothetical protein VNU68_23510 [Verrucomicrobiae bacterium]|jgi:hypothetical protein|nr:hypothetical protein [Verrucomicrobiae bacterium]
MTFATEGIPPIRRHVYFYLLLFLGTVVADDLWKNCQTYMPDPDAQEASEIVTTANRIGPQETLGHAENADPGAAAQR